MRLDLRLDDPAARATTIGVVVCVCGWLLYLILSDFVVGALTDERIRMAAAVPAAAFITAPFTDDRIGVNPDALTTAASFFPDSPRLHMRLAEFRKGDGSTWRAAEFHAMQATRLSPHDYRPWLLLGSIQEYKGDLQSAEESVRSALQLAPNDLGTHWQLGTLLLTRGNLAGSLQEYRVASLGDPAYFEAALKMVWSGSGGKVDAVRAITPNNPRATLGLARFLLEQSRPLESAAVFREIDRDALLGNPETSHYLNRLITAGQLTLAHDLWCVLLDRDSETSEAATNLIWNGGFESDILLDFAQFDWSIQPSNYARVSIDSNVAHGGHRSLRVDFLGRETTRLDEEIKQLTLVRPGARYQLDYYVKTDGVVAPQGPRVVVTAATQRDWIAASDPAPSGSNDWQQRSLEFAAPSRAITVAIKQRPKFSYEDPTHGTVWFDDFRIREVERSSR